MSIQPGKRLSFKSLMLFPWIAVCLCHAEETVFVLKAQKVTDKVYAIIAQVTDKPVRWVLPTSKAGFKD
jgi:hypothetical protein